MKTLPIHDRHSMRVAVSALMLIAILTSLSISVLHSHRDCGKTEECALCAFQSSGCTMIPGPAPEPERVDGSILHSLITTTERVPEPFATSVFSSHAPPHSC